MERISKHQFMIVSAAVLLGTTFVPIGQIAAQAAGRDGWWSVLPAFSLAIPFGLMILSLAKEYPGWSLLQITAKIFGKWPAKGISFIYVLITGYFGILLLARVGDTFRRSILPLVPTYMVVGGIVVLSMMVIGYGVEVFARFSEIAFPLVVLGLMFTMLFTIPRFEWGEFFPVFGEGILPVIWGAIKISPFAMEYVLFLGVLLPYLPQGEEERLKTGLIRATVLVGLLSTALVLTEIMVFGPEEAKRLNYGLLALGKMVEVSKTLSGVESIFMLTWMGAEIIKISALFGVSLQGFSEMTGWKRGIWLHLAFGAFFLVVAVNKPGGTALTLEVSRFDEYVILPFGSLWVVLLFGVAWLKRRLKQG